MKKIDEKLRHCTDGCSLSSIDAIIQNALDGHFVAILVGTLYYEDIILFELFLLALQHSKINYFAWLRSKYTVVAEIFNNT